MKRYNNLITKYNIWVGKKFSKTVFLLFKVAKTAKLVSRKTGDEFGSDDVASGSN